MTKKLLIAPNSFKECADSVEIASLIKENLSGTFPEIKTIPLSDGGDGFLEVCRNVFNLKYTVCQISAPYKNRKLDCKVGISRSGDTAFIESAKVLGLNIIPPDKRRPAELSSRGLGEIFSFIQQAFPAVKKVIIGIGGTGTNDFGLGAAGKFGLDLLDENENSLDIIPLNYIETEQITWKNISLPFEIEIVADVDNLLLGEHGATRTFAKQKGASKGDIELMEMGFKNIYDLLVKNNLWDSEKKLSGAGGGLAAGLQVFFNAKIKYAKDFILNDLKIKNEEPNNTVIITGEGKFDFQTLMDKAPGVIINHFKDTGAQIFVICGIAEEGIKDKIPGNVKVIELQKYFSTREESIKNFKVGIEKAANEIAAAI